MLFNSYEFILLFMPISIIGFYTVARRIGQKAAVLWLVICSLFFYGWWDFHYVFLLMASICFNFCIGKKIECSNRSKRWLILGVLGNIVLLGYFKYFGFFIETVNLFTDAGIANPNIVLPLGISFFTFTQTAYLVDTYRRQTKEQSFLTYVEFVTIFPHLIAGPILTHRHMMPQFLSKDTYVVNWRNMAAGITLFTMGLAKKVLLADHLSPLTADAFSHVDSLTFFEAWIGALSYTLQLYFDFSGYSEMAIGLALMLNLKFPTNFDSPYKASSIIDFWRRWHMTLGLWVKEYLYIPLGGNRHGELKKMRNLFLSMLIIGIWHGAGYTFIIWGALHGVYLMINHQWRRTGISLPRVISWPLTFLCVIAAWVFFRADSVHDALIMLAAMTDVGNMVIPAREWFERNFAFLTGWGMHFAPWTIAGEPAKHVKVLLIYLLAVLFLPNPQKIIARFWRPNRKWALAAAALLLYAVLSLMQATEFLYFQF